jgi:hypothetical protein
MYIMFVVTKKYSLTKAVMGHNDILQENYFI